MWQRVFFPYYATMHLRMFKKDTSILKVRFIFLLSSKIYRPGLITLESRKFILYVQIQ